MLARATAIGLYWFFSTAIALFSVTVVGMASVYGFETAAPYLAHYIGTTDLFLYGHIVFGPLALMLAPLQFWRSLRSRWKSAHRLIGYVYAASIVIAGFSSLLLLPRFEGSTWAAAGFGMLAVCWIAATARAAQHARAGRYGLHRTWMVRSAAFTFAAVVLRLMTLPLMGAGMTLTQSYDITAWLSWLLPLIAVEWWRRRSPERHGPEASSVPS